MNAFAAERYQCSHCDRDFTRKYNLRRHEETVHNEGGSEQEEDSEVEEPKRSQSDSESEMEDSSSRELEDNPTYQDWYGQAIDATEEMRTEKYSKYINEGLAQEQAREKAYIKTTWALKRVFFDQLTSFLWEFVHLKEDETYQEIMGDIEEKMDNGVDVNIVLKRVITKHRAKFDGLFEYADDEEEEGKGSESDISDE